MLKKLIRDKEFFSKKNIEPIPKDASLLLEIFKKDKEIEKLNNIINELEKYIKEMPNNEYFGYLKQNLLDELKELKEGK